jgi:hypothetical protein
MKLGSLVLQEESRVTVLENYVLRRMFETKRKDKIAGGWAGFHSEAFHSLCSSPHIHKSDQIVESEMCGACSTHW